MSTNSTQAQPTTGKKVFVGIILVAIIGMVAFAFMNPNEPAAKDYSSAAKVMSEAFVKVDLKSPSTAKFSSDFKAVNLGANRYSIISSVEAQNSFGATATTPYQAIVRYNGGDELAISSWSLEDLKMSK